jgi:hypothetical protein
VSSLQAKVILKILQLSAYGWAKGSIPEQRARLERLTALLWIPKDVSIIRRWTLPECGRN